MNHQTHHLHKSLGEQSIHHLGTGPDHKKMLFGQRRRFVRTGPYRYQTLDACSSLLSRFPEIMKNRQELEETSALAPLRNRHDPPPHGQEERAWKQGCLAYFRESLKNILGVGTERTEPALKLLLHTFLNARSSCGIVGVVEGLEDLRPKDLATCP